MPKLTFEKVDMASLKAENLIFLAKTSGIITRMLRNIFWASIRICVIMYIWKVSHGDELLTVIMVVLVDELVLVVTIHARSIEIIRVHVCVHY